MDIDGYGWILKSASCVQRKHWFALWNGNKITTCLHLTMKSWKWPLGCYGLSKKGTSSARTWCRDTPCFSRFSLQWLSNRPVRVVMLKHRMIRMLIERSLNHMRIILVQHRTTTTWFTTMPEGNSSPKQPVQLLTSEHRAPILSKQSQRSSPNYISRYKQDINRTSPEYPTEYHSKPTNQTRDFFQVAMAVLTHRAQVVPSTRHDVMN